jgi:hypothetical protein
MTFGQPAFKHEPSGITAKQGTGNFVVQSNNQMMTPLQANR